METTEDQDINIDIDVIMSHGRLCESKNDNEKAREWFNKALAMDPNNVDIINKLGKLNNAKIGNVDKAKDLYHGAAKGGNIDATGSLAEEENNNEAHAWFNKAQETKMPKED